MVTLWPGRICLWFLPKHDMGKRGEVGRGKEKKKIPNLQQKKKERFLTRSMTHYEQTEGRLSASYRSSSMPQVKPESDQQS